jgi:hypothetical protein
MGSIMPTNMLPTILLKGDIPATARGSTGTTGWSKYSSDAQNWNELGIGIDFRDIKAAVKDVLVGLDHCDLNGLPMFTEQNPTSETLPDFFTKNCPASSTPGKFTFPGSR